MNNHRELEAAKERLAKGRKSIKKYKERVKNVPDTVRPVSGNFDEVELKRIERHGED